MIRPISLFLFVCLSFADYQAFSADGIQGLWILMMLVVAPAVTLLIAPIVKRTEIGVSILSAAILLAWGTALFVFGWAEYARGYVGNYILLDEILILLPPVLSLSILWWMTSPVEHSWTWVSHRLRIDVLLLLIALLFIWGARESIEMYVHPDSIFQDADFFILISFIVFSPYYIRFILNAKVMKDTQLLLTIHEEAIRAGFQNPRVFIWNTHNLLMNAMAIGILFTPKTIILTDKLIRNLTKNELLAVVRHEFAHHRYWHLPFLILAMACTLIWTDQLCDWISLDTNSGYIQVTQLVLMIITFVLVSTQFERQADAYSAIDYSKSVDSPVVTEEAVQLMNDSLSALAFANGVPVDYEDALHGSIDERQKNLHTLIGCPVRKIPINRRVKMIKIVIVCLILLRFLV